MNKIIYKHRFDDTTILFIDGNGIISLVLVPSNMLNKVDLSRDDKIDGIIQLSLTGDVRFSNYSSGQTMRNSSTADSFRVKSQKVLDKGNIKIIETIFCGEYKMRVKNVIIFDMTTNCLKTYNILKNCGNENLNIEMFSSFALSGISPYAGKTPNMKIHRMLGNWSAEGRPECRKIESAGLEQSWANYGVRVEKFGSIGSMPVQRYFPFVCLEDVDNDTFWGVMLETPCSWQMEVTRYNNYLSVSGGIADYEYGHVRKLIEPKKTYTTTAAYITVCQGGIDNVCNRLRSNINKSFSGQEERLPVLYNEYCASWGGPTHESVIKAAKTAKECGAEYFVMDAGWYCDKPEKWSLSIGDFKVNEKAFPLGISETVRKVREIGLVPGIWFEFECVATQTNLFKNKDMFLTRDGKIIIAGNRAFLDFRKRKVRNHLKKTVIDFLKNNGFGYIKIDYNECIGIGCDGGESYGSGLNEHISKVIEFIDEIRANVPNIVIETCASGGHRIEPLFLSHSDMTSFSDAHECYEGAVIAANVNKLCPSRKNQIWAVVNNDYSVEKIRYSLAKTFFGRLCLSGDIDNMSKDKVDLVKRFVALYKSVTYILKDDENFYFGNTDLKYLDLVGEQAVLKKSKCGNGALIIVHGFKNSKPISVSHECLKEMRIKEYVASPSAQIDKNGECVTVNVGDFDACVIHLVK